MILNRVFISAWGLVFSSLLLFSSCSSSEETAATVDEQVTQIPVPHEYSIEALAEMDFSGSPLVIEEDLGLIRGVKSYRVSYESEGNTLYALMQYPNEKIPDQGFPVIVLAHGYIPPAQYSTEESYILVSSYFASKGFLVLKPDYRGHDRSGGIPGGRFRTIEYSIDTAFAANAVALSDLADPQRMYLYGHSMGGEIAVRLLVLGFPFKAATLWAPVTEDFPENTLYFVRKRDPESASELLTRFRAEFDASELAAFSPFSYLDRIQVPILLQHGTADESVPYEWSEDFAEKMKEAELQFEFKSYLGHDHNISQSFYSAMDADIEFFLAQEQ
jgi:dipeptidyl aminopeptidase/acylaminoacyl peptidase